MEIRTWEAEDTPRIVAIHDNMALGYKFPEVAGPLFGLKRVAVNGSDVIHAAAAVKIIGEAFLWVNPASSDYQKASAVAKICEGMRGDARILGLEDIAAFPPPAVEINFASALAKMGFRRSPWACWGVNL